MRKEHDQGDADDQASPNSFAQSSHSRSRPTGWRAMSRSNLGANE